jgi:hypothetical protein
MLFDSHPQARSPGYQSLREGIYVLYSIWGTLAWSKPSSWSSKDDSLSMIYSRTRVRCRRVLEHLFRIQSAEVLESVIDCWSRENGVCRILCCFKLSMISKYRHRAATIVLRLNSLMCLLPVPKMLCI